MMLEELQGRKSLHWWVAWFRNRWFDSIPQVSELPDHLPGAQLLRSFAEPGAAFFVTHSLMQDQRDQATLSMGNGSDCLIMSQARDRPAIYDLEDTSFGPGSGIRSLIE
jgi:hypothetical protein